MFKVNYLFLHSVGKKISSPYFFPVKHLFQTKLTQSNDKGW